MDLVSSIGFLAQAQAPVERSYLSWMFTALGRSSLLPGWQYS
jgi:hypothetical protein